MIVKVIEIGVTETRCQTAAGRQKKKKISGIWYVGASVMFENVKGSE
jgi:hypothetical protein